MRANLFLHLFAPENLAAAQKQRQIFLSAASEVKKICVGVRVAHNKGGITAVFRDVAIHTKRFFARKSRDRFF